ncbi:transcriptional regulator [Sulfolobales archaeon HS-7]|nr:transcriptional regulator [Sulfolobales archaeon HS-7]
MNSWKLVLISLILLFPLVFTVKASTITVLYNGTVVAHITNERVFYLIGENASNIKVLGSSYQINDSVIHIYSNATITYVAKFKAGVLVGEEPYNVTYFVLIPEEYNILYVNPSPCGLYSSHGYYNISFYGESFEILYSQTIPTTRENNVQLLLIIVGLVIINGTLSYAVIAQLRQRKAQREDEPELNNEQLNDRDLVVLESIRNGSKTLADVVRSTGLPKSTAYRRIKKLVKLGYVKEVRENGKIWYEVVNKQ